MRLDIPISNEVDQLRQLIREPLYGVGGVVRDALMHKFHDLPFRPKDVDLSTSANPDQVLSDLTSAAAKRAGIKAMPIGKAFGVVSAVFPSKKVYEIATFRKEWYDPEFGDGRHPDKVEFSGPEEDAKRRDLTINALFLDLNTHEVMDYVGTGIHDIRHLVIRPVGNPHERFAEDRLRVLRLVRFFCRYRTDRLIEVIAPETLQAVEAFKQLDGVSSERIRVEFLGGLAQSRNPKRLFEALADLDLFSAVFPSLEPDLDKLPCLRLRDPIVSLAILFRQVPIDTLAGVLNRLSYSREECNKVRFLHQLLHYDPEQVYNYVRLRDRFFDPFASREEVTTVRQELLCQVENLCRLTGLDRRLMFRLMHFYPCTNASKYPDLSGAELGRAIRHGVNQEFRRLAEVG